MQYQKPTMTQRSECSSCISRYESWSVMLLGSPIIWDDAAGTATTAANDAMSASAWTAAATFLVAACSEGFVA